MAKFRSSYVCQNCGAITQRWQGKCESCGEWNTIIEEAAALGVGGSGVRRGAAGRPFPLEDLSGASNPEPRVVTGIAELDRVAGGGFVPGSATLIGGEPGIGKSTLLIQACAAVARSGARVIYVSGEESTAQVRLRAARLGLAEAPVQLAAQTFVEDIVATLGSGDAPKLVVIDSIQTMWSDAIESAPGTVSQVRGSAQALIRFAKASGAAILLVGHVTKDGQIAGPRVVEHMVDAVFSFEGDSAHAFRLLRAAKNRFGATDEVGVFEMTGGGLDEVPNPSALFLADRDGAANPGAAVFAGVEGARPLLVEIQALVAPTTLGTPRRAVVGWEPSRLAMVLAVLEAHGGMKLGQYDVYLNVAGGLEDRGACGGSCRGRGACLLADRREPAARRRLFRRNCALGLGARGRSPRPAPQGGGQARICQGLRAGFAPRRRRGRQNRREPHRFGGDAGRAHRGGRSRNEAGPRGPRWGDELTRLGYKALAPAAGRRRSNSTVATRYSRKCRPISI